MGRVIVTNTVVSKKPYYMKKTGHPLYSYEELCYYMKTRPGLWMDELTREGLTDHMREWNLSLQEIDSLSPYEAAQCIMEAGNYFRKEEQEQILGYMREYNLIEEKIREKEKGDLYLSYGKSKSAYMAYWKAVSSLNGQESSDFKASLYHNMAVVCCRFFYWKEARNWFALSLNEKDSNEARSGLELVLDMEKKGWIRDEKQVDKEKVHYHKELFLKELE